MAPDRHHRRAEPVDAGESGVGVVDRGRQRTQRDLDDLRQRELDVLTQRPGVADLDGLGDRLPRWTEWQLLEGGERFRKADAQRIEADVRVPAGGETVLRYTVRYRWAADITLD